MKDLINRLKIDILEHSGASPSFLNDLRIYMAAVENLASNAQSFGTAFPNACAKITGTELADQAAQLTFPFLRSQP